jgi:hypothetical protein
LSPLRSDGSRDDHAGEAGPVEHSSAEAKRLKLEAKGLSGCHPSGQQPRQPDGKARGQIKDFSHNNLQKNIELNPYVHGSFTEPMPHECGQICPQDLWVKLPTPVRDGCQTLRSVGGIISGRERLTV